MSSTIQIQKSTYAREMVFLGVNNGSGNSASNTVGQNKNGTRTPELVDLDGEKTNERNGGNFNLNFFIL